MIIRLAEITDLPQIRELSSMIWDGDDYLGDIAEEWIAEGGLYVGIIENQLVAVAKQTIFPEKVLWLEGLRVHPDWQGKGLGKEIARIGFEKGRHLMEIGDIEAMEFSTHRLNVESVHITSQAGFEPVQENYSLDFEPIPVGNSDLVEEWKWENLAEANPFLEAAAWIPYGWKFLHNTEDGWRWLLRKGKLYRYQGHYFYLGGARPAVILLSPNGDWFKEILPAVQALVGVGVRWELMLPAAWENEIVALQQLGFYFWEGEVKEPNVIVCRYDRKQGDNEK